MVSNGPRAVGPIGWSFKMTSAVIIFVKLAIGTGCSSGDAARMPTPRTATAPWPFVGHRNGVRVPGTTEVETSVVATGGSAASRAVEVRVAAVFTALPGEIAHKIADDASAVPMPIAAIRRPVISRSDFL